MVNVIVAEDEQILLDSLALKIRKFWPEANIVAKSHSGEEALENILKKPVQVAFLDIQMGDMSGIEVALKAARQCHFIFVTAYDQYAVSAFEAGAIDYLLKPYSDARLQDCIDRVRERLGSIPLDISQTLLRLQKEEQKYLKRIKVQIGNRIWLVPVEEVLYLQASGRYVQVVTSTLEALVRMPLKALMDQLDPEYFWQIHRSIAINIHHLDHVSTCEPEQLQVHMKGRPDALPVSRSSQYLFRNQLPSL